MHLIFFDEVKSQPNYPHYHIGAICVDEKHLPKIEGEISKLALQIFGDVTLKPNTEFHACDIYHRKKAFKNFSNPVDRIEIIGKLLQIVSAQEVKKIDIQINVGKLSPKQSASEIAFMFLCERANDFMKTQKSYGMLIGDRDTDALAQRFSVGLSEYRARGTSFAFGQSIEHLFESVHFTPSHLSRFLQLADVYAWILQFSNRHQNSQDSLHKSVFALWKSHSLNLFASKYKEWPR